MVSVVSPKEGGGLDQYTVLVKTEEEANNLVKALEENKGN